MTGPTNEAPSGKLTQLLDQIHRTVELNLPELRRRDADAARGIDVLRRAVDQTPAVVVIGEQKRGKSSLINALLGTAGVSPVDIEVATSAYLVFRYGDAPRAVAHFPDAQSVEFDISELRDWGTVLGSLPADTPPRWIEIWYPALVLKEMVLVDTPGVGGLDPAHADAALEAVGLAAALLFVVDASAPLMEPERVFLQRSTRQVRLTIFAITKKDKYDGWSQILDENRANLATHVPSLVSAPWYPASARLALVKSPDIVAQSGIEPLRGAVTTLARHGRLLRQVNVLHAIRLEFERLRVEVGELVAAVDPDPQARLRIEQELSASDARAKMADQDVNLRLNREFAVAQAAATHEVSVGIREIDYRYQDTIAKANSESIKALPAEVEGAVQAMLARLTERLSEQFQEVTRRALADLLPPEELNEVAGRVQVELTQLRIDRAMSAENVDTTFNLITSLGAFGAVSGVAAHVLTGGLTLIPMALGVGALMFVAKNRRQIADRTTAQRWLSQSLSDVARDANANLTQQLADLRHALQVAIMEVSRRRRQELAERIREMKHAEMLGQQERAERKKALLADQQGLGQRTRALGELLTTTSAAIDAILAGPTPAPQTKGL